MPQSKDRDFSTIARNVVEQSIGERLDGSPLPAINTVRKSPAAVHRGHLGGLKGGKARATKLTTSRRRAIAKKGAAARWGKKR